MGMTNTIAKLIRSIEDNCYFHTFLNPGIIKDSPGLTLKAIFYFPQGYIAYLHVNCRYSKKRSQPFKTNHSMTISFEDHIVVYNTKLNGNIMSYL